MPPLPADSIHARACKLKCEKILTRPSSPDRSEIPYGSRFGSNKNGKNNWPGKVTKTKGNPSESTDSDGFMNLDFNLDIFQW